MPARGSKAGGNDICDDKVVARAKDLASQTEVTSAEQIAAYAHAISVLRDAPVPRTIIAVTGGIGLHLSEAGTLDGVSLAAAEANVGFYGLIAVDDLDLGIDTSPERTTARRDENDFFIGGMQSVAIAAGGDAQRVIGQADRFYTRIVAEASGVYHLGVEAPTNVKPSRYLSVKVSVKRSGVTVQTNAHAVQPAVEPDRPSIVELLKQRIEQGGAAFGVPLTVTTARRRDATSDRIQMLLNVDVPATAPGPLNELFAVLDATGHVIQSGRSDMPATPGDDYRLTFAVPVAPGDYRVRVAVGDANGSVGAIDAPISARLATVGRLTTSDLVVMAPSADGPHLLAFETLPAHAQNLDVALELYPVGQDTANLRVRLTVEPSGGGAAVVATEVTPTARDGRLVAGAWLSVASLPPGTYVMTATVVDGTETVGVVSTHLRKVQ